MVSDTTTRFDAFRRVRYFELEFKLKQLKVTKTEKNC